MIYASLNNTGPFISPKCTLFGFRGCLNTRSILSSLSILSCVLNNVVFNVKYLHYSINNISHWHRAFLENVSHSRPRCVKQIPRPMMHLSNPAEPRSPCWKQTALVSRTNSHITVKKPKTAGLWKLLVDDWNN